MNVGEFATLVEKMRAAQKKYFKTHSSDALKESKDYEKVKNIFSIKRTN